MKTGRNDRFSALASRGRCLGDIDLSCSGGGSAGRVSVRGSDAALTVGLCAILELCDDLMREKSDRP